MLRAKLFGKLDERRVRMLLAVFFLALTIPAVLLIVQAASQLKWEAFRSTQVLAEDLAARIDADLRAAVAAEEARSFGDYAFLVVEGDAAANFVQRSPLSAFPVESAVPGVVGYFQVDDEGALTTPLLPAEGVDPGGYGIAPDQQQARRALAARIGEVLAANRLVPRPAPSASPPSDELSKVGASPDAPEESASVAAGAATLERGRAAVSAAAQEEAPAPALRMDAARDAAAPGAPTVAPPAGAEQAQAGFDRFAANAQSVSRARPNEIAEREADGEILEFKLESLDQDLSERVQTPPPATPDDRQKRTEQSLVPEPATTSAVPEVTVTGSRAELTVQTFASELDPFTVGALDTGHLVMFRNVWRDGRRYVQGALIEREQLVAGAIERSFRSSSLAGISDIGVAYQGTPLTVVRADAVGRSYASGELAGSLLHRARLAPPFGDIELVFSVRQLPRAAGFWVLGWVSVVLAAVLIGGFFLMYRFAIGQMRLARQQQDFVSAVSHELKTPLTSIRMYGEMLKAGWADEAKKRTYYEYIHSESERLSRLIDNVLQLARLTRNSQHFDMKRATVAELMDMVRSKVSTQVERAGFALTATNAAPADAEVLMDTDCFVQIVINLVDNALKFSVGAERKVVEIACRRESDGRLLFTVRDFGPGIPKSQMKKIFELFYRPENELTRETVGTGIGLALVRELATAMNGRVDVRNCEPGAEFRLSFAAAPRE